jgi:hypothetical protein
VLVEQGTDLNMLEVAGVFGSGIVKGSLALRAVMLWKKVVSDYGPAKIATRVQLTKTRAVFPTQQFFGHGIKYKKYPGLVDR